MYNRLSTRYVAAFFLLAATSAFAQQDLTVYDDALRTGWQDWSWGSTINYTNTTSPYSGSACVSVSSSGFSAFYLHHAAFDLHPYSNLTFRIRGQAAGGQLWLRAMYSTNTMPQITLPALTTSWTSYSFSLAQLGLTNAWKLDAFWLQNASGSAIAYDLDDVRFGAVPVPAVVNVKVTATQTVSTVDERFFGLNTAVWDSVLDTTNTVGLLRELDNRVLRFPGGSTADDYHWRSNTIGTSSVQWPSSTTNFMRVATNTGAQVFITVNYGSGTADEAADWVRWANITNGLGFKYWEVGNENYGYWEADTNARPHDPFTYATQFKDYVTAMKAADPTIRIGAVASVLENSWQNYTDHPATNSRTLAVHNGWTPVMLTTMKSLGVTPDFLIYHRYAQSAGLEDDALLLQSSSTWADDAADLRQQLADYLGPVGTNVELVCTENNSVDHSPGKQTTSLVNGLFLADSIAQAMRTEFRSVLWWDLRNAQEGGNNNAASLYGWRNYGDYGITDSSNTSSALNRYPTFFAAKLLKYFARGGDRVVASTSDYGLLSVYAVQRKNNFLSLLVINKSATSNMNANIVISGFSAVSNAPVFSYGIPQDNAASTNNLAGADIMKTNLAAAGTNFTFTFAPYSMTVIALASNSAVTIQSLAPQTNGTSLQIQGMPDLRYMIQSSSNMVTWPSLATNVLSGITTNWLDATSTNVPMRFYRSLWIP